MSTISIYGIYTYGFLNMQNLACVLLMKISEIVYGDHDPTIMGEQKPFLAFYFKHIWNVDL